MLPYGHFGRDLAALTRGHGFAFHHKKGFVSLVIPTLSFPVEHAAEQFHNLGCEAFGSCRTLSSLKARRSAWPAWSVGHK